MSMVEWRWEEADQEKVRPVCFECGDRAAIVCASPGWESTGFNGAGERAVFCCLRHCEDVTANWYWFHLVPCDYEEGPSIADLDFLLHLWEKPWGQPFLSWLFNTYQLRSDA